MPLNKERIPHNIFGRKTLRLTDTEVMLTTWYSRWLYDPDSCLAPGLASGFEESMDVDGYVSIYIAPVL